MKQKIRTCFVSGVFAAAAVSLIGCGGGRVVVANPQPAPAAMVAPTPAGPAGPVVVTVPATPAPPAEDVVSTSPGPEYVWVKGYYNWDGSSYQWVPGTWVRTPRSAAVWVPAHWQPTAGGYVWVPGTWR